MMASHECESEHFVDLQLNIKRVLVQADFRENGQEHLSRAAARPARRAVSVSAPSDKRTAAASTASDGRGR